MAKRFVLSLIIVLFYNLIYSQCFWAKRFTSTSTWGAKGYGIDVDATGNVYSIGQFSGSVAGLSTLGGTNDTDIYINKKDSNGNTIWSKSIGSLTQDIGHSLVLDQSGNIYITGYTTGTADFDPSASTFNLGNAGSADIFIAKYDNNGNFIWAKRIAGAEYEEANSIALDANGNILVTGQIYGTTDFNPGSGVFNLTGPMNFVLKLDSNGNFVWAKNFGNGDAQAITCDQDNNILVTGFFSGTIDFDPGLGFFSLTSSQHDIYVLKLNSAGDFLWAVQLGGTSTNERGWDIATDGNGNVFTSGQFTGTADFDPGPGTYNLTGTGGFLSKLSSDGLFLGAARLGGLCQSVDIAADNRVITCGIFGGTEDFDPGPSIYNMSAGNGIAVTDMFISYLNNDLGFIAARHTTGSTMSPYASSVSPQDLSVDDIGNVHVTGGFGGATAPIDFDPGPGVFNMTGALGGEGLVYKLYLEPTSAPIISANGLTALCQGQTVSLSSNNISGNIWNNGATAQTISVNAAGNYFVSTNSTTCLPLISNSIEITLNYSPAANISATSATTFCQGGSVILNANTGTGLTYQWFNNASAISGATTSSYAATASGSYTVVVTNASTCSATSSATVVTVNALPTAAITPATATTFCQGGSVVLNANTGTGLTYQWRLNGTNITGATSSSYTANASGSYTVVVTNASTCSATSAATVVTVNALPAATITPATATTFCQGGSVVLNANTGTGLSYQWYNNASAISGATSASYTANASGSYTVVVTNASTCSSTSTATFVTVNALPTATITPATATTFCQGGSVVLNANTGTGLSYQWYNNASAISGATSASYAANASGSYTVVVTNASTCSSTSTATVVTVNALPTATITPATATTFCQGGSVVLTASTGNGLTYQWKLNGTNITGATSASYTANASGSYTVVVTNASTCSATSAATVVTVNALPTATITPATATTFCQGGSVVLNANTGTGLSYQWYNNASAISGATFSSYTANASGSYTVVVTNASTCSSTSAAIDVTAVPNVDYFADADGDGFGDAATLVSTCIQPQGYVIGSSDCDDTNFDVNPSVTETCNHIDDDCSGTIDDGLVFNNYYADTDGDTYGDPNNSIYECSQPNGYVTNNTDCNDNNVIQNAASAEICNGEDDDCDGAIDNGLVILDYYADLDSDGFGAGVPTNSCVDLGAGYVNNNTDCNDTDAMAYPNANETCNNADDNCDGQIDEGVQTLYFIDSDGDTYGNPSVSILACAQPAGYTPDDTDCNDTDANINPGAEDIGGNGIDENCDGEIDNSIFELNATISLYPNPTRSELNIQVNSSIIGSDLFIFDAVGNLVYNQKNLSTQTAISVSNLANGNYIARVGEMVKRFEVIK